MLINRAHTSPPIHKPTPSGWHYNAQQILFKIPWGLSAALGTIVGTGFMLGPAQFRACVAFALFGIPYFYAIYKPSKIIAQHIWYILFFCIMGGVRSYQIQKQFLRATEYVPSQKCSVTARVVSVDFKPSHRFSYVIRVNNANIINNITSIKLPGMLELYVRKPLWLLPGDHISIKNIQLKPYQNTKMRLWALRHNLIASAFLEQSQIVRKNIHDTTLQRTIQIMKISLLKKTKRLLNPTPYRLFKTIILGITHSSYATDKLRCAFMSWGLAHMLARSGLHMLLIVSVLGIIGLPLGTTSVPFSIFTISTIFLLSLFSWNGLSFIRSVLMWITARAGLLTRRRPHALHILGLTATYCILWQPAVIFFLDFQLTFGVTSMLGMIAMLQSISLHTTKRTNRQSSRRRTTISLKLSK